MTELLFAILIQIYTEKGKKWSQTEQRQKKMYFVKKTSLKKNMLQLIYVI